MGYDLQVVDYRSSVVPRDYEFFEWLEGRFGFDGGTRGYIDQEEFEEAVKEESAEWREKYKDGIDGVRKQFEVEKARLPEKEQKFFSGFDFCIS